MNIVTEVTDLAKRLLIETSPPEEQRVWRMERNAARWVLRAARSPHYADQSLAMWDRNWLGEVLEEIAEARREFADEPCDYHWDEREHVATSGR